MLLKLFQHKEIPYCHIPCYSALFGPRLFGHGSTVESHQSFGKRYSDVRSLNFYKVFSIKKIFFSGLEKSCYKKKICSKKSTCTMTIWKTIVPQDWNWLPEKLMVDWFWREFWGYFGGYITVSEWKRSMMWDQLWEEKVLKVIKFTKNTPCGTEIWTLIKILFPPVWYHLHKI